MEETGKTRSQIINAEPISEVQAQIDHLEQQLNDGYETFDWRFDFMPRQHELSQQLNKARLNLARLEGRL